MATASAGRQLGPGERSMRACACVLVASVLLAGCLCPSGQLLCDGECADPRSSPLHCGRCGRSCAATEHCDGANCVPLPTCGPTAPSPVSCDDGDACNGVYDCVGGRCQLTIGPPSCDDGVACTLSYCDPALGRCVHPPDDALCEEGQTCSASSGCLEPCRYAPCSVIAQCGCFAEDTCAPDGARSAGTCVLPGSEPSGSTCFTASECQQGLICVDLAGVERARCSAPCRSDADCDEGRCFSSVVAPEALANGETYSRCEDVCDPVTSSECVSPLGCRLVPLMSGGAFTLCGDVTSTGTAGRACTELDDCARNHICVGFTSGDACARLCHGDRDCSGGLTCRNFATRITLRGENVGYCG